jgi:hypothetical protein
MLRLPVLALAASLLAPFTAWAQDKTRAAEIAKPALDNDRLRVSELHLKPGGKLEIPGSPNRYAYLLTDATLVFRIAGKTPYELRFKAGEATLLPADTVMAENETSAEIRAVIIDIKGGAARSSSKAKRKARSGSAASKVRAEGK